MKIVILVPDGVGIRNYLYSDLITELRKNGAEICLYHKVSDVAIKEIEKVHKIKIEHKEIADLKEGFYLKLLRESAAYARLIYFKNVLKNKTILDFWGKNPKYLKLKVFYFFCKIFGTFFSKSYNRLRRYEIKYENKIKRTSAYKKVKQDLKVSQPDFILNLHQRSLITTPVILAAQELKIKNSTIIFSWDNIPKGRLICRPDMYFVWSDLMKIELCLLYKEISPKNVYIVGSPQFEFYKKKELQLTKEAFFKKYNLDIHKKTICFSGDDKLTSPHDQVFFEDLCSSLQKFPESERPQIIFRRCPVDFSDRYDAVLEKYKNDIAIINPDWRVEKPSQEADFTMIYPTYNDLSLLVNTCLHSDVVVNLGSTMAHDFAIYDKPCLYLNYNPKKDMNWSVERIYQFEHFKSMENLNAVGWITNPTDFYPLLKKALTTPDLIGTDRKLWLKRIIQHPLEKNSINLANLILEKCTSAS
ncbi:Processive diacylglycerol beta-glucosyltransferase [Polaribacter huanghezhanensis]|uniref:hypothetical protein n=1 Tax=Polaribacter huanghezhanensis TaxID=1354726 RepID=UPI0026495412|nr:hypothetical protein [Polaribacter huanghezhanensis]WKD86508.1 Processive diacylglycerol beta-glucosyltransferase [Polaribacter huanghezhanensis]